MIIETASIVNTLGESILRQGGRLQQLRSMLLKPYELVWDCCCDHGLFGMSLMDSKYVQEIIFVDVLADQLNKLESSLSEKFPHNRYKWQVTCDDVRNIVVPKIDSQLFVLAGVGGGQTVDFINSLSASAPDVKFDILTCSVHGSYFVRESLIKNGFSLIDEMLIFDKNRVYEGIYVTKAPGKAIESIGYSMWNWEDEEHQRYWSRLVGHYMQKARNEPEKFRPIIEKYETLRCQLMR
jgi:tRNA (adenine22-N1)-methyltransferase